MGAEDPRLVRLSAICAALPEAERELSGRHATFRVRRRTFAYFLDDHRGDEGIVGVVSKAPAGQAEGMIGADPRYYRPAYLGHRGWVGLRLDTEEVDWEEVAGLVGDGYLLVAPKRLAAQAEQQAAQSRSSPVPGSR
jgi:predicted DNA-binding protein (MmcQ/YjbR family)